MEHLKNWKEYFEYKFSNEDIFIVDRISSESKYIESYSVKLKDKSSETEIIYQLVKDKNQYLVLHDIYFTNPNSPALSKDNKNNPFGSDMGEADKFNIKNLMHTDDYIGIPLYHGWIERTYYYKKNENKVDVIWIQNGKSETIPIRLNYSENIGCVFGFFSLF